jgi:hypothetical protein
MYEHILLAYFSPSSVLGSNLAEMKNRAPIRIDNVLLGARCAHLEGFLHENNLYERLT